MEFKYMPLISAQHIRLVYIVGNDSSKISLTLSTLDLSTDEHLDYKCLSYTWDGARYDDNGPEWTEATKLVHLDGHIIMIRPNLYDALQNLYSQRIYGPLWVDAICINQNDIAEKSSQVANMYRIYKSAEEVVIWLGRAYAKVESALNVMESFPLTAEDPSIDEMPLGQQIERKRQNLNESFTQAGLETPMVHEVVTFAASYRWFSRTWTVQEFILGRKLRILCGDIIIQPMTLYRGSLILMVSRTQLERTVEFFQTFMNLYWDEHRRRQKNEPYHAPGIQALRLRSLQAKDPRDKIFALRNITERRFVFYREKKTGEVIQSTNEREPEIIVNYNDSVTVKIVFQQATMSVIASLGIKALSHVGDRTRDRIPGLPSWVIDFTRELEVTRFQQFGNKFCAGAKILSQIDWNEQTPDSICIIGAKIDVIEETCDAFWENDDFLGYLNMLKLIANLKKSRFNNDPEVDHNGIVDDLIKTLIADGFSAKPEETEDVMKAAFQRWVVGQTQRSNYIGDSTAMSKQPLEDIIHDFYASRKVLGIEDASDLLLDSLLDGVKQIQSKEDWFQILNGFLKAPNGGWNKTFGYIKDPFYRQWALSCRNRQLFRTTNGALGLGFGNVKVGDCVYVIADASTPFILRPVGVNSTDFEMTVTVEGDAYLHGVMYGNLADDLETLPFEYLKII